MADQISDEEKQLIVAYQKTFMGTPEGQLVFWDLMNKGYVFRPYGQHNASAYALEGKRAFALEIFRYVEFAPGLGMVPGPDAMDNMRKSLEMVARFKKES